MSDIFSLFAASIEYLTGTRIVIQGESTHVCEYKPALAEADLGGSKQVIESRLLHFFVDHLFCTRLKGGKWNNCCLFKSRNGFII